MGGHGRRPPATHCRTCSMSALHVPQARFMEAHLARSLACLSPARSSRSASLASLAMICHITLAFS